MATQVAIDRLRDAARELVSTARSVGVAKLDLNITGDFYRLNQVMSVPLGDRWKEQLRELEAAAEELDVT